MKFKLTTYQDITELIAYLGRLDFSQWPRGWAVQIKRIRSKRSLDQNALYWKWLGIIAESEYGASIEAPEIHEAVVRDVFGENEKEVGTLMVKYRRSSTAMDTKEFAKLMKRVEALAVSLGISLPYPEDNYMEGI